jgi:sugar/nucleoside kinase (ribokinase family)
MSYDVYGIGNALVDMEFVVDDHFLKTYEVEKGLMTLVELERQHDLMNPLSTIGQHSVKKQSGGSAANTVIAATQLGATGYYACRVSNDEYGTFYLNDLANNHVATRYNTNNAPDGITGKCMVMVTPDAQRTMNTYLGITASFSKEEIIEEEIKKAKWLYIEGYLVASPTGQEAALHALEIAKKNNVKVAYTMSDPNMVKFFGDNVNAIVNQKLDLLFCNDFEALEYTGEAHHADACEKPKNLAQIVVVTNGTKGADIWDNGVHTHVDAHTVEAIDTNGAGDMFAGAFMYGLTQGMDMKKCGNLASLCASRVVTQYGPRLDTQQMQEMLKSL